MGIYAVTGSASGMGREVTQKLRHAGHDVIGIDQRDADIIADLSTADGRRFAGRAVLTASHARLDGAVLAAGVGPVPGAGHLHLIFEVNYFGVVDLLDLWRPALAVTDHAKVVAFSSNSTTTTPLVSGRAVRALLEGDTDRAVRAVRRFGPYSATMAYAVSKTAVSRWVRRTAVTGLWVGAGIRLNALAPGAIMTPMLQQQLSIPAQAKAVLSFPVPVGGYGDAGQLAEWVVFMLSDAADFLCGSVIVVDGGSEAWFRSEDWPQPIKLRGLVPFLIKFFDSGPAVPER